MSYYHHDRYPDYASQGYRGEGGQQYAPTHYDKQWMGHDGGHVNRLETQQIIGERNEPEVYAAPSHAPLPAAAATATPISGPVHRKRLRAPGAVKDVEAPSEAEGAGPPDPPPTRRKRRRNGGSKKGVPKEVPANAALVATRHRHRMRAEIDRCFGFWVGVGVPKAKRDAPTAETAGVGGHNVEMNSGNEECHDSSWPPSATREEIKDDGKGEALAEKDALPFLPLFGDPGPHLSSLYDDVESALEDREETWAAVEDAHAEVEEARRRLRDALVEDASIKQALEEAKDRAREAELEEPCKWNEMLRRMREFYNAYGHVRIPDRRKVDKDEDPSLYELAGFALQLRERHKRGTLQRYPHRVKAVEELGFEFHSLTKAINSERFQALREFKEKHGHINVRREDDEGLHMFVHNLRSEHKYHTSGKELSERSTKAWEWKLEQLKELVGEDNFEHWSQRKSKNIEAIRTHRRRTGHCVHPDLTTHKYIKKMRKLYWMKKDKNCRQWVRERLPDWREKRLDEIGLCWTKRCTCKGAPEDQGADSEDDGDDDAWETNGEGWADVDDGGASDAAGGTRSVTRNRLRSNKRKRQKTWEKKIAQLKEFKAEHGHCQVSSSNNALYNWALAARISYGEFQRKKRRRAEEQKRNRDGEGAETDCPQTEDEGRSRASIVVPMTDERAAQLEEVMGDDIKTFRKATFERNFNKWKEHKEREGNCVHPEPKIRTWLSCMKLRFREGVRRKLLEDGKLEDGREDDGVEGSETEAEVRPQGKKKGSSTSMAPLSRHQIDMFNEAGVCWGRCLCSNPQAKEEANRAIFAGKKKKRREIFNFDKCLAAVVEHKRKYGSCLHPDKNVRLWLTNVKARRTATLEKRRQEGEGGDGKDGEETDEGDRRVNSKGKGGYVPLSDKQMSKLDGVDLCWGRGCRCQPGSRGYESVDEVAGEPNPRRAPTVETKERGSAAFVTDPDLRCAPAVEMDAGGPTVTMTVAELGSEELEKLAMGVVDKVREIEGWSTVECSSSDDGEDAISSDDGSSGESGDGMGVAAI